MRHKRVNVQEIATRVQPIGPTHTHPDNKSWPWLVATFVLCPCHIPIVLAILGTGALGGALARNSAVVFVALTPAFAFAVWRYVATTKEQDACPACVDESRQSE